MPTNRETLIMTKRSNLPIMDFSHYDNAPSFYELNLGTDDSDLFDQHVVSPNNNEGFDESLHPIFSDAEYETCLALKAELLGFDKVSDVCLGTTDEDAGWLAVTDEDDAIILHMEKVSAVDWLIFTSMEDFGDDPSWYNNKPVEINGPIEYAATTIVSLLNNFQENYA